MNHLRQYENFNINHHFKAYPKNWDDLEMRPQIGDYVIMKTKSKNKDFKSFLENNVGKVSDISTNLIEIEFVNLPKFTPKNNQFINNKKWFNRNKIIYFSKTPIKKEDIGTFINANKYDI